MSCVLMFQVFVNVIYDRKQQLRCDLKKRSSVAKLLFYFNRTISLIEKTDCYYLCVLRKMSGSFEKECAYDKNE